MILRRQLVPALGNRPVLRRAGRGRQRSEGAVHFSLMTVFLHRGFLPAPRKNPAWRTGRGSKSACLCVRASAGLRPSGEIIGIINDGRARSEEHTSELQSLMRISYAVFCVKKKKQDKQTKIKYTKKKK